MKQDPMDTSWAPAADAYRSRGFPVWATIAASVGITIFVLWLFFGRDWAAARTLSDEFERRIEAQELRNKARDSYFETESKIKDPRVEKWYGVDRRTNMGTVLLRPPTAIERSQMEWTHVPAKP